MSQLTPDISSGAGNTRKVVRNVDNHFIRAKKYAPQHLVLRGVSVEQ
ncbi:hypothetical protein JOF48_002082 [Arthrobacter stackebrandtii]|uniref:Uncharacterized protein n=1 Tax=Arthrobacter stackebrandtii TaxID=272161 RepID=A0ABS4YWY4_9MICC|nr:hypothetical protein [Arthrobacter stackebrandtii]